MVLGGILFLSWRVFEVITLIPIVGMLSWFVHGYTTGPNPSLTPTFILVLFIVSVLALVWAIATVVTYLRARHSALFVALVDLAFVGAFIAGVVLLRGISNANCVNWHSGSLYADLGPFSAGYNDGSGTNFGVNVDKSCAMLKASFALGIIECVAFFVTFVSTSFFTNVIVVQ